MIIPTHPKYNIDENGKVTLISTGEEIPEFRNRFGRRAVKIRGVNFKIASQSLDRLMLKSFKPLEDTDVWKSVKFRDGNRDNISVENLEWSDEWYEPKLVFGKNYLLGTWVPVPGFSGMEISFIDNWYVRNVETGQLLPQSLSDTGYKTVGVWGSKTCTLHRMIALVFLRHPVDTDHLVVNHKNSDVLDNSVNNLEWTTHGGNLSHAYTEGFRSSSCKRVKMKCMSTGTVVTYPSVNEAARFLNINPGMVHNLITHRKRRGLGYKGYLIKNADDPVSWEEMEKDLSKNQIPYKIAVRDYRTGEVVVYNSLNDALRKEEVSAKVIYRLLLSSVLIPCNGKCFQSYKEDGMFWPDYPLELVDAFSRARNGGIPIKVTDKNGNVEYSSGVTEWCEADRVNRCDPAVLSREISRNGKWRDWVFEKINLETYSK